MGEHMPISAKSEAGHANFRVGQTMSSLCVVLCVTANLLAAAIEARAAAKASPAEIEIRSAIQKQTEAWNRHDLEGFMAGYWNSPELTFYSGGTVTTGWQPTLERYQKSYQAGGHEMGKLEFSELQVVTLGPDSAFVRGHWQLTMSDGKTPHGLFTLVFRKLPEGWRIVHDHTSSAQ